MTLESLRQTFGEDYLMDLRIITLFKHFPEEYKTFRGKPAWDTIDILKNSIEANGFKIIRDWGFGNILNIDGVVEVGTGRFFQIGRVSQSEGNSQTFFGYVSFNNDDDHLYFYKVRKEGNDVRIASGKVLLETDWEGYLHHHASEQAEKVKVAEKVISTEDAKLISEEEMKK